MTDCLFCKIAKKEIPSDIVYEDEEVLAFMDIQPVTKGHTIIIPKTHYDDFESMNPGAAPAIIKVGQQVAKACKEAFNATAFNIGVNNGEDAGQTIFHVHWHVIPRYPDDGLESWGRNAPKGEHLQEHCKDIKKHLHNA